MYTSNASPAFALSKRGGGGCVLVWMFIADLRQHRDVSSVVILPALAPNSSLPVGLLQADRFERHHGRAFALFLMWFPAFVGPALDGLAELKGSSAHAQRQRRSWRPQDAELMGSASGRVLHADEAAHAGDPLERKDSADGTRFFRHPDGGDGEPFVRPGVL